MFNNLTLINAVPGAGKTTFMINEVYRLVIEEEIPIWEIAFVTFSKTAAEVAKERVRRKFGELRGVQYMWGANSRYLKHFCTIHSMCFSALNLNKEDMVSPEMYQEFNERYGYKRFYISPDAAKYGFQTGHYDVRILQSDNGSLLESLAMLYRCNKHAYYERMNELQTRKSAVTNEHVMQYMVRWEEFKKEKRGDVKGTFNGCEIAAQLYDFTDLLEQYVEKKMCEEGIRIVFIDEAQDLSYLQWQVLMHAFRGAERVYAVADPRQNMFKWAGSSVDVFLSLKGTLKTLDSNYRCRQAIVDFVNSRIVKEISKVDQLDISMKAHNDGGSVDYIYYMNDLLNEPALTDPTKKILMLAADNYSAGAYRDFCRDSGIPYTWMGRPIFTAADKREYLDNDRNVPPDWEQDKKEAAYMYHYAGTLTAEANVHIMTIHQSKGDEADVVVVCTDLPKKMHEAFLHNPYQTDLLFYVACTRARDKLYIFTNTVKQSSRRYTRL